jgi:hypothetical protein
MEIYHLGCFIKPLQFNQLNDILYIGNELPFLELDTKKNSLRAPGKPAPDTFFSSSSKVEFPMFTPESIFCKIVIITEITNRNFIIKFHSKDFAFLFFCIWEFFPSKDLYAEMKHLILKLFIANYDQKSVIYASGRAQWLLRGEKSIVDEIPLSKLLSLHHF